MAPQVYEQAKPLISNIRRLPTPTTPRFTVRHCWVKVTATRGYWLHHCWDDIHDRSVRGFRTIGLAMDAVQALNVIERPVAPKDGAA
jgi:hypothetical protein